MSNWGKDFVADCTGAPRGLTARNHAWWNKYSDKIQKFKLKMEKHAHCYEETECGCYAPDEEIKIEKDKCILNLGTFPDFDGWWKFTFELKINSLPKEGDYDSTALTQWAFEFLSIAFDRYDNGYDIPQHPSPFISFNYEKISWAGQSLFISTYYSSTMMQPKFLFEEGQWYKFTVTGKPIGSDGKLMFHDSRNPDQKPAKCRVQYLIEGPGLVGNKGEYRFQTDATCLDMEFKTIRDYPIKVFAARQGGLLSSADIMDGVVRNIIFENEATDTSIDTTC